MSAKENGTSEPSGASLTKSETQSSTGKPGRTLSIIDQLSRTKTKEEIQSQKKKKEQAAEQPQPKPEEPAAEPPRGRDQSESVTTSTNKPRHPDDDRPSMALAPKSTRIQERSISPGQLPDGSHVVCSGQRGEGYTPPSGLGRLGGKIRGMGH